MTERWRPIQGYEGAYEVSDLGRVRSVQRVVQRSSDPMTIRERIRRQVAHKKGDMQVVLSKGGIRKTFRVHQLVATAFIGPCPTGHEVLHGDGRKAHNAIANLRYGTRSENEADKLRHGTSNRGERHGNAKLSATAINTIFALRAAGKAQKEIAKAVGVLQPAVSRVLSGKRWGHRNG